MENTKYSELVDQMRDSCICLFDYFAFTVRGMSITDVVDQLLGMAACDWEPKERGRYGYKSGMYYKSVSVFDGGTEEMGVLVEMTGAGCRTFESESLYNWQQMFFRVGAARANVTRLDVAFDDRNPDGLTGILDLCRLEQDLRSRFFVSKSRKVESLWFLDDSSGVYGRTLYIGSPQSNVRIRIYDKAVERGHVDLKTGAHLFHWIRVELQLRDGLAAEYVAKSSMRAGDLFADVLLNYLRFVDPMRAGGDSNVRRWPMAYYWEALVGSVHAVQIYSSPGREYNAHRCADYVFNRAGNAIDACLDMFGVDEFLERLRNRSCRPNPKYKEIIDDYRVERGEIDLVRQMYRDLDSDDPVKKAAAKTIYRARADQLAADEKYRAELRAEARRKNTDADSIEMKLLREVRAYPQVKLPF